MTALVSLFKDFSRLSLGQTLGAALMELLRRLRSEIVDDVEVRGSAAFRARTREALEFLRLSPLFGAARDDAIAHVGTTPGRSPRQRACRTDSTQVKLSVWARPSTDRIPICGLKIS